MAACSYQMDAFLFIISLSLLFKCVYIYRHLFMPLQNASLWPCIATTNIYANLTFLLLILILLLSHLLMWRDRYIRGTSSYLMRSLLFLHLFCSRVSIFFSVGSLCVLHSHSLFITHITIALMSQVCTPCVYIFRIFDINLLFFLFRVMPHVSESYIYNSTLIFFGYDVPLMYRSLLLGPQCGFPYTLYAI